MHAIAGAYRRVLPNGLVIASVRAEHAAQLESLQRVIFPTLADDERFKAAHYLKHLELFPAGQFVGLDGDRVVAATATIRLHFDFTDRSHTFADILHTAGITGPARRTSAQDSRPAPQLHRRHPAGLVPRRR